MRKASGRTVHKSSRALIRALRLAAIALGIGLVMTAGAVPIGAGMMMPGRDPGGGGMKQPLGPIGRGPAMTPAAAISTVRCMPGGGGTKATPGGDQWPVMKSTTPSRCS